MSELKTQRTNNSVEEFIATIEHDQRREDATKLLSVFKTATNMEPALWGTSIIGYGQYHYTSERSRQEGDWPLTGFSPRKANMTVYIMPGFDAYTDQLANLGKHTTSVSCIYFNRLSDIDTDVLKEIISASVEHMKRQYSTTS